MSDDDDDRDDSDDACESEKRRCLWCGGPLGETLYYLCLNCQDDEQTLMG
jgi:hypothetical protein